ncbi:MULTISPECIES: hypothetical protein [unclassified Streptococcus]|uniref:hypothetical protein n=1 Tax=unclassified Streptococcus TaxID=2608887 RepID=UPI001072D309|nr:MULTISPECIES: hypothetical protein [unclassified Streptococcus]MBF0787623.1 hypothetical protein [Streptococcus sp. 19428wC2_LYSM12]MCQ9212196.1 hypothetical protein [Streptococcus sp. B01]MCQ9213526.1 hypothetical protein [Streptococcus sp. O1]TFV05347.1 hypothetical protein E4T79_06910 [Streptococcus sp. LYSM12]
MKKFLSILLYHLNVFLGNQQPHNDTRENEDSPHLDMIQLALYKKAAIHIIYADKSFTGEIVKFDPDENRMIVKNFKRNVTSIITLSDIQRISLVPDGIRQSQKQ